MDNLMNPTQWSEWQLGAVAAIGLLTAIRKPLMDLIRSWVMFFVELRRDAKAASLSKEVTVMLATALEEIAAQGGSAQEAKEKVKSVYTAAPESVQKLLDAAVSEARVKAGTSGNLGEAKDG